MLSRVFVWASESSLRKDQWISRIWPLNVFLFAEIFPRDLRKKEKVIKHLTGEQLLSFLWPQSSKWKQMCLRILTGLFSFHQVLFISVQNAGSMSTGFTITPETAPSLHVSTVKHSHLCRPHKIGYISAHLHHHPLQTVCIFMTVSCRLGAPDLPLHMEF